MHPLGLPDRLDPSRHYSRSNHSDRWRLRDLPDLASLLHRRDLLDRWNHSRPLDLLGLVNLSHQPDLRHRPGPLDLWNHSRPPGLLDLVNLSHRLNLRDLPDQLLRAFRDFRSRHSRLPARSGQRYLANLLGLPVLPRQSLPRDLPRPLRLQYPLDLGRR